MINSVGLSWIMVSDMNKAKHLFIDIMGFEIHNENEAYQWLELKKSNTHLGVCAKKEKSLKEIFSIDKKTDYPGQNAVVTFYTSNINETINTLKNNNIMCDEVTTLPNVFYMTTFYDEDMNKFEIFEFIENKNI